MYVLQVLTTFSATETDLVSAQSESELTVLKRCSNGTQLTQRNSISELELNDMIVLGSTLKNIF
jgi:hypothetical protein